MTVLETSPVELPRSKPNRALNMLRFGFLGIVLVSIIQEVTGIEQLTASGTVSASLRLAIPILLAALGGMFSERAGIVNIGLEGMMIMGTWFSAWGAFNFGPWWGVVIGMLGGALGGLLHALATVTFKVDHIVSGVAINILGLGGMRFLSVIAYESGSGGGSTQSPRVPGIPTFDTPFLAGGRLFGWETPNLMGSLEAQNWLIVSDFAGVIGGVFDGVSWLTLLGVALVPISWFALWRTAWGLRLRSCGENPWAAESLGVNVYLMKYWGVVLSGALAGLGGTFLVLVQASIYREGQTAGRGFIGLATLIFGNWTPLGALGGATLFGFSDALRLRDPAAVRLLFLVIGVGFAIFATLAALKRVKGRPLVFGGVSVAFILLYILVEEVPVEFISMTPYVVTLLVLAVASQRLRMPAADGLPYRRGEDV